MNVWDARIEARKLLGIKKPYEIGEFNVFSRLNRSGINLPDSIPTDEDKLDVEFWSIVSDLRAVISGNLVPRDWSDYSFQWRRNDPDLDSTKLNARVKRMRDIVKDQLAGKQEERKKSRYVPLSRINKMKEILVANGASEIDALIQARKLLRIESTT